MDAIANFISPTAVSARRAVEIGIVLHQIPLRRFAWRLCRNKSDVDDLLQETLCTALEKARLFDCNYPVLPWLFTMMRNINVDRFRREKKINDFAQAAVVEDIISLSAQNWAMEYRRVSSALNALSAAKRQAIVQIADGHGYVAGAIVCGCDINTMKTRVRRARQELIAHVGDIFSNADLPVPAV